LCEAIPDFWEVAPLQRAHDIIGLPVISIDTGKRVGTVKDVLITFDWTLMGILLDPKRWFASPRLIAWEHLVSLGPDAVTIADEDVLQNMDEHVDAASLASGEHKLKGLPVITVNGRQLGFLEDVYFEEKLGRKIEGLEISDGFISDLKEGRKRLPAPDEATIGDDAVIVPASWSE
jgi:uncharacterized protein YrrD